MKKAEVVKFLLSKHFFKNLGIAVAITLFLIIFVFTTLRVYTHHGESFSVPDLTGLTLAEVEEIINSYDLRFQVSDSVYLQNFTPGTVVDQLPKSDFKVKKNRTVFLTMNAVTQEMVGMPKVVDRSLREAESILRSNGLELGKRIYKPDIAEDYVLEQHFKGVKIETGEKLPKGSVIDLVLGTGLGDRMADVPNLIGIHWERAEEITINFSFNLGAPLYDNSVLTKEDSVNAKIFKQKPVPRLAAKIPLGSYIDVWLTIDSAKIEEALVQIQKDYFNE